MKVVKLRNFLLPLMALGIFLSSTPMSASDIAIVNIKMIVEESLAAKSITKQVEKIREEFQDEITKEESKLYEEERELGEQRSILSKEVFEQKAQEFRSKVIEAQKKVQASRARLDKAHIKAIETIRTHTLEIISDLSKEKGFAVALIKAQVLYSKEDLDISTEVLEQLNKKLPEVEVVLED